MKKVLVSVWVLGIVYLLSTTTVFASDLLELKPEEKSWETTIGVGYKHFTDKDIGNTATVSMRMQSRLIYPLLAGFGFEGSFINDVVFVNAYMPVTIRLGVYDSIKADVVLYPGVGYAKNTKASIDKVVATGTAGLEIKKFVTKGVSVGIGGYYQWTTYDRLKNAMVVLTIGF